MIMIHIKNVFLKNQKIILICDDEKKKIIDKEIQIRVFNIETPELTLTDLGGMIYNVFLQINDLGTQESIKYAKEYNENSIIIFTKIVQVLNNSKGEDLYYKIMKSNIHKIKKPIIARNMTFEEYENNISRSEIRKKEIELIEKDKFHSSLLNECKELIELLIQKQKI